MRRWYVVQTHHRKEAQALAHLRRQGFEVYLPCYQKRRRHARRTDSVMAPLFPRYLFVLFDIEIERWHSIHSTVGVGGLVRNGELPAAVPLGVVEEIKSREDELGSVVLHKVRPFKTGEKVRVISGAMCDQVGLFETMDDQDRIIVLLNLLGREVRVRLPAEAITASA